MVKGIREFVWLRGCTFNKVMRLGFFKLIFDKMLIGNNRDVIQRYL